jgi:hypothetical protein
MLMMSSDLRMPTNSSSSSSSNSSHHPYKWASDITHHVDDVLKLELAALQVAELAVGYPGPSAGGGAAGAGGEPRTEAAAAEEATGAKN